MLISFLKKGTYGYLREDRVGIYGFFSNNNLSFRKEAILDAGGYEKNLRIAEDYDACQRVARAGWLLYYCPEIGLGHRARKSLRGLLRQWWNYGYHLPFGFKHHYPDKRILAWKAPEWDDEAAPEPLRGATGQARGTRPRFALAMYVYLSAFVLFHASLLACAVIGLAGFGATAIVLGAIAVLFLCTYAYPDFSELREDGPVRALMLFAVRYCVNCVFLLGGMLGGLRCGALYVFPPIGLRVGSSTSTAGGGRADDDVSDDPPRGARH